VAEAAAAGRKKPGGEGGVVLFVAVDGDDTPVTAHGLYRTPPGPHGRERLSNFTVRLLRDVFLADDFKNERVFEGTVKLDGESSPFSITAEGFADSQQLQSAVFVSAGPAAQFVGPPAAVRRAISAVSKPERVRHTTAHGWDEDGTRYLTVGGVIDAGGWRPYLPDEVQVELLAEGPHKGTLGLTGLPPQDLRRARRLVVNDLLRLHDRAVSFTMLAAVALAVLEPFGKLAQRPGVWLNGLTGAGKSFLARLFANFFADAPIDDGTKFGSWTSTANYIERAGYFYRGALFLVDDYKPDLVKPEQALRLVQTYADGSARGRLQADARANVSRPIRGLFLATGEDLPENNASVLARLIVVPVPNRPKDIALGRRCREARHRFRGVTTDFIAWLLRNDRLKGFAARVAERQEGIYRGIAGLQNDARIAGNFALLAASFEEIAACLADVWPDHEAETAAYIGEDLPALLDGMMGLTRDHQASEVFWSTLQATFEFGPARLQSYPGKLPESGEVFVGRYSDGPYAQLSLRMALGVVQEQLRRSGRPVLKITEKALAEQLRAEGKVEPEQKDDKKQLRVAGAVTRTVRVKVELLGVERKNLKPFS
jgi:hypothetical protein